MPKYLDLSGASPIESYEIGTDDQDTLTVTFRRQGKRARSYLYTAASCPAHIAIMIELAAEGIKLATYISQHKPAYARRW